MRITQQIKEDTYIIKTSDEDKKADKQVIIQHDYIGFKSSGRLETESCSVKLWGKNQFCANVISVPHYVQIPIRIMSQVVLPMLNSSEYLTSEHLVQPDGKPKYTYCNNIIHYWNREKKVPMVAICLQGETEFNHVTEAFFDKFVKPNL